MAAPSAEASDATASSRGEAAPAYAQPAAFPMPAGSGALAPQPMMGPTSASPAPPLAPRSSAAATGASAVPSASVRAPLITYSGEMGLRVAGDAAVTIDAVVAATEALGGYLSARRDAGVEVRVPSGRFREAMAKIETLGEVTHRGVSASDVSEEFHDGEVRLTNLRATRARLQELLAKTGSLGDTLTVERELERVALDIDRLEGRLEYLKSRVAFSSLVVSVDAHPKAGPVIASKGPRRFVELPVKWLDEMGTDHLLTLR